MKYALDVHIISNNAGLITAVKNVLPNIDHPGIWNPEFIRNEDTDINDNNFFTFRASSASRQTGTGSQVQSRGCRA
jgi:hypothetical protein